MCNKPSIRCWQVRRISRSPGCARSPADASNTLSPSAARHKHLLTNQQRVPSSRPIIRHPLLPLISSLYHTCFGDEKDRQFKCAGGFKATNAIAQGTDRLTPTLLQEKVGRRGGDRWRGDGVSCYKLDGAGNADWLVGGRLLRFVLREALPLPCSDSSGNVLREILDDAVCPEPDTRTLKFRH
jgi:hypothetical protein